jgi:hypothetical protein
VHGPFADHVAAGDEIWAALPEDYDSYTLKLVATVGGTLPSQATAQAVRTDRHSEEVDRLAGPVNVT